MFRLARFSKFTEKMSLADKLSPKTVSHSEAVQSVWAYIKRQRLQSESDRRFVVPDEQLSEIVGQGKISFGDISTQLSRYMISRHAPKESAEAAKLGVAYFPHL